MIRACSPMNDRVPHAAGRDPPNHLSKSPRHMSKKLRHRTWRCPGVETGEGNYLPIRRSCLLGITLLICGAAGCSRQEQPDCRHGSMFGSLRAPHKPISDRTSQRSKNEGGAFKRPSWRPGGEGSNSVSLTGDSPIESLPQNCQPYHVSCEEPNAVAGGRVAVGSRSFSA